MRTLLLLSACSKENETWLSPWLMVIWVCICVCVMGLAARDLTRQVVRHGQTLRSTSSFGAPFGDSLKYYP